MIIFDYNDIIVIILRVGKSAIIKRMHIIMCTINRPSVAMSYDGTGGGGTALLCPMFEFAISDLASYPGNIQSVGFTDLGMLSIVYVVRIPRGSDNIRRIILENAP